MVKVLHLTTWEERCGIADYAANMVRTLDRNGVDSEVFPINRVSLKYLSDMEIRERLLECCRLARNFDLVHVQHEFGFFNNVLGGFRKSVSNFGLLLSKLRGQAVAVTFHTPPPIIMPRGERDFFYLLNRVKRSLLLNMWRWRVARLFNHCPDRFRAFVHTKATRLMVIV
jgi:hypothetical protein